jgi:hypothetical protein
MIEYWLKMHASTENLVYHVWGMISAGLVLGIEIGLNVCPYGMFGFDFLGDRIGLNLKEN